MAQGILLLIAAGFFFFGIGISYRQNMVFSRAEIEDETSIKISGKVVKTEEKSYSTYIYIETSEYGTVILSVNNSDNASEDFKIGNIISASGRVDEFKEARNYGNYDEKKYYHSLGVSLRVKAYLKNVEIIDSKYSLIGEFVRDVKENLVNSINRISKDSQAGFFTAICTGNKDELDSELKSLFQENGIAHILAVSGLHISLLGLFLLKLLRKCFKFSVAASISFALILFYCVMCGWSASAVRALIMFGLKLLADAFGKKFDMLNALSVAVIFLLISNPNYVTNSGFIYSVTAVFSISVWENTIYKLLWHKHVVLENFLFCLFLYAALIPLNMTQNYCIPTYSAFINMAALPLMSVILASGMGAAIAGIFLVPAGKFIIGIGSWSLSFIEFLCNLISKIPGSQVVTGNPGTVRIFIYYCVLAALCLYLRFKYLKKIREPEVNYKKVKSKAAISPAVVMFCLVTLIFSALFKPALKNTEIIMFDVDQGESILIRSPSKLTVMIDGGSSSLSSVGKYRIKSALKYLGVSSVDYCIITHPDADHTNGITELLEDDLSGRIKFNQILIPDISGNEEYEEIKRTILDSGIKLTNIKSGDLLPDKYFSLICLHPDKDFSTEDINDYSAVFLLDTGEFNALFTGDLGGAEEYKLLSDETLINSLSDGNLSLLKVSHHGSKYSSSEEFLEALRPKTAIISAGINNIYGHPAKDTLNRLSLAGSDTKVTANSGEIIIKVLKDGNYEVSTKF